MRRFRQQQVVRQSGRRNDVVRNMSPMGGQPPTSACVPRTKPACCASEFTSSMPLHEEPRQRKRRRDQSVLKNIEEQPSAKRRKTAPHNHPPEFWNALSKITLTRRALRELDRRTTLQKTTQEVEATNRSTRLLRSDTEKLLRTAKNGGPNLNHLRGVSVYVETP